MESLGEIDQAFFLAQLGNLPAVDSFLCSYLSEVGVNKGPGP